jgi:hypothetical protein
MNDNLQTALEKIDGKFQDVGLGYIFENGIIQLSPGQPVRLGGSLMQNTTINSAGYTFTISGSIQSGAHITTGGTSSQFVKGDGSLDSTTYQPAGSYITGLTGDGIASGPGNVPLTLATVNANPGTYGNAVTVPVVTVNAKGLVTNITPIAISIPADSIVLVGDVSAVGVTGTNITATLATVNSNVYGSNTFLKFAVNGKGLVTSATPVVLGDLTSVLGFMPVPDSRTLTINGLTKDLTADRTWNVGTVTSVQASVPPAFSVTSAPITSFGTINIVANGDTSQYIRGDGSLAAFPAVSTTSGTSGTSGVSPSITNIYNSDGTLTGNRVMSLDSKRLIFRDTNATLTNYTYSVGVPTGVTAPTWPSSFVYEGQYNIVPGTGPQIFNTRVWGRNTSATNNNLWVQETFADITSESTSFTNIYNQTFFTGRGSTLDTSTATASVMRGIWSNIGHRYAGSQSTTVQINTNNIQSFYSTIVNYIGNVSNAYGYFSSLSQGSLTTSQTNTLTNHYAFYAEATIGSASGGSSTVTNYYGLFLNTPTVGATGVITNRWGVYAPDSAMSHYLNGNVVIGTTTLAGYKLDVSGTSRLANTLSSGFGTIISTTQTQANSTDVGDGAVSVSHSISATSATNELVIRAMSFGSNNNLTGGGAVTNHRVWNVASSTQAGSITTDLDQIFIERGNQANGTVTNNRAIRVNTMQGTNRAGFACVALSGTNNVYALLGTVTIPTGNWGIHQTQSNFNNYFAGKILIGTTTDPGLGVLHAVGGLSTDSPAGGTARTWKLGQYNATAPTATGYIEVEVNGVLYKLLAST